MGTTSAIDFRILNETLSLQNQISAITVTLEVILCFASFITHLTVLTHAKWHFWIKDHEVPLSQLCYHPVYNRGCLIESPLEYFQNNQSKLESVVNLKKYIKECSRFWYSNLSNLKKKKNGKNINMNIYFLFYLKMNSEIQKPVNVWALWEYLCYLKSYLEAFLVKISTILQFWLSSTKKKFFFSVRVILFFYFYNLCHSFFFYFYNLRRFILVNKPYRISLMEQWETKVTKITISIFFKKSLCLFFYVFYKVFGIDYF